LSQDVETEAHSFVPDRRGQGFFIISPGST